ncbi:MAG: HD domain-containing protein [Proteobacteria bacterium]|nr:bifunctional (p)ppGpp synthetase/guanosine-3',5'-bis(diphosphate) 3'-pyrophosphohydrolase [Desulfocapsa sp.]MBU3944601.1 HD domain-containing protein [Pseudomonadota bacterium]MBU3982283.1 HD domain-containing protein [Pseudomonadota bacterium]MBU4027644.1 HD domain-containing protein [Pseudomonadota bacterium]MBU4043667.1 HD domain-containing protein [Pseudomonadota bacterium]
MQYNIPFDLEIYRSHMRHLLGNTPAADVFWRALDFAIEAHDDQWRRSGEAYIMHPCSVAKILADEMDITHPEILAAALLHDTVEDVEEITTDFIGEKFGHYVEAIVEGCTKITQFKGDKQTQYKMIHRKIFSGAALRPEVMLVKLADRLHNLRTLSAMPQHKRQKIADETIDIYAPLASVLGLFSLKREMFNLALSYKFPKQSAKLITHIKQFEQDPVVMEIVKQLKKKAEEIWFTCNVIIRTKGLWAYYDANNRILRRQIDNPVEILIVVESAPACYQALGILNQTFPPIPRTIRDLIANPKNTGYQSLHARANIKGREFLFKIRTEDMTRRAQRGLFKGWSSQSSNQRRFIREIQELFNVLGSDSSVSYRDVIAARGKKEIYTYTPQGDLAYLPINSTVLDFAFHVHTDIGNTCLGAMIGSKRGAIDTILQDGDVVRIIRAEHPIHFDLRMLEICKTPRARAELAKTFKLRSQQVAQEIGLSVISQEIRRYNLPSDLLARPDFKQILAYFDLKNLEELYLQIGEGRLKLPTLIDRIKTIFYAGTFLIRPTGAFNTIELTTLDPAFVKMSACCKPSPTDSRLYGLLSERGLSVHSMNCQKLETIALQREDIVYVRWKQKETFVAKKQTIIIMAAPRKKMMMYLSVAPEEMKVLDLIALSKTPTPTPAWELVFEVPSLFDLRQVLKHFDKSKFPYEFVLEF